MKVYTSRDEAIMIEIIGPISEGAPIEEFDIDAIANELIATVNPGTDKSGYILRDDVDFWQTVGAHDHGY